MIELLQGISYFGILGVVILGVLLILSFFKPLLKQPSEEINEKLKAGKEYLFRKTTYIYKEFAEPVVSNFKRDIEKQNPSLFRHMVHEKKLIVKLVRLSNKYGKGLDKRLQKVERSTQAIQKKIGKINFPDLDEFERKVQSVALEKPGGVALRLWKSSVYFWLFLIVISAIISINTFLMNEFWFSLAPGFRKLIPMLNITFAMLFAFIFAVFEVGSGALHYATEDRPGREDMSPFQSKIRMIIVYVIVVLALIEGVAFWKISANLRFADQLGLLPTNPLYDLVNLFLAPFGPAITLMLVALGYKVVESFFDWREYRQRLKPILQLKKLEKQIVRQIDRANDVATSLDRTSKELVTLDTQLGGEDVNADTPDYRESLKGQIDEMVDGIRVYFIQKKDFLSNDVSVSDLTVIKNIIVGSFFFMIWLLLLHLVSVSLTRSFDSINFSLNDIGFYNVHGRVSVISSLIALFIGISGYLVKRLITGEDYTTAAEEKTRHLTQYVYIGLIVLALTSGLALTIISLYIDDASTIFSFLVGLFMVLTLYLIGVNLDHYLAILSIAVRYILISIVAMGCFMLAILVSLVWVVTGVVYHVFDLVTKPGEALRNAFAERKRRKKQATKALVV